MFILCDISSLGAVMGISSVIGDGSATGSIHDERSSAELSTEVVLEVAPRTNVLYVGTIPRSR